LYVLSTKQLHSDITGVAYPAKTRAEDEAMTPEEQAENLLLCFCWHYPNHHETCPAYFRPIVAAALRENDELIRRFLYEPLPGSALPEKYEKPYTVSQESWNRRLDWLIDAIKKP
jgi:hypothetical protein